MTEFFLFENLTWPEVAGLPRDIPILLPLGTGYPLKGGYPEALVAESLSHPPRIAMLPPFPFGWRGSGLEVPEPVLSAYISNLLNSLRDDGFTQVFALTPQDIDLGLGAAQIRLFHAPTAAREPGFCLPPDSEREKVIILPIGHTEQHAYHLPLSTDTLIIDAIANGTAKSASHSGYTLTTMPYGVSTHRSSYAGTLNAGGRAFEDFWLEVVNVLVQRGFKLFYLMSGHGGNMSFLVNVVKYAGECHRRIFCATAFLHTSGPDCVPLLEQYRESGLGGMGHACELETSYILHLRPDLVHMERVADDVDFVTTPSYYMDWIEGGTLIANPPWDDDSISGAYGAGSLGTAEKGKIWLEAAIAEKVKHLTEIQEQHRLREERRRSGYGLWGRIKPPKPD
jgi:creatinine amidohydrolase